MLNILFWLVFGSLVGWVVALMVNAGQRELFSMIIVSIGGAILGGLSNQLILHNQIFTTFNGTSIVWAVMAAIITVSVLYSVRNKNRWPEY